MFDEDQEIAFRLSHDHNLVISGQAGTGKTYLVKEIVKYLRNDKKVAITCSTGIAATHYGDLEAVTLHKWAGIEDGRHTTEELVHLVVTDERFEKVKSNIQGTDLLVIDEISMISAKTFNQLEKLCRIVRNNNRHFGGMQVILAGDFYQLPPVANEIIGDAGNHCYKVPWFDNCFPHKIKLNIIHRQNEATLIKCINEVEVGDPSDESVAFLKSLDRPLPDEDKCIHLFARNYDVDLFNYNKLQKLPGELKIYRAKDEGSQHYLRKFLAPKNLGLKVGCPVMLVRNLSDTLVNGLRGSVVELTTDEVDVKFVFEKKTTIITVKPVVFTIFDPVDKIIIAKRTQLPLKLAYAMTVHKAQGMTLKTVVVNCDNCYQPGQIGVAIGRAEQVEGLRVINFNKSLCRQHPLHVTKFYDNFEIGNVKTDLSCCRELTLGDSEYIDGKGNDGASDVDDCSGNIGTDFGHFNSDSDFSESEIEQLELLDYYIEQNSEIGYDVLSNGKAALDSVYSEFVGTPLENEMFSFKQAIQSKFPIFNEWFQSQSSIIEDIGLVCFPEGDTTYAAKQHNNFFVRFHKYLNSDEYKASTLLMLSKCSIQDSGPQYQFLTTILFHLERKFFAELSGHLNLQDPESFKPISVPAEELSGPARGKIRYISGYVLAKTKHNLSVKTRNSLYNEEDNTKVLKLQSQMHILNSLCSSYDVLKNSTKDVESLQETKRKQNDRESLTNLTDTSFDFFMKLETVCRKKLTHINLVHYGKNLFSNVTSELENDSELFELWVETLKKNSVFTLTSDNDNIGSILNAIVTSCENVLELYHSVVQLFLKVSFSQFRRDFLSHLKKEKGKALRKKVMEKSKKTLKTFNIQCMKEDKSVGKISSHLRLKSEIASNNKFLTSFPKKDLLLFCQMYDIKVSSQKRKDDISKLLNSVIQQCDTIPFPDKLQTVCPADSTPASSVSMGDDVPGPSGYIPPSSVSTASDSHPSTSRPQPASIPTRNQSKKGKGRGKGKGKGKGRPKKQTLTVTMDDSDENCVVCNGRDYCEDWISCDTCNSWFHRNCANLQDDEEWSDVKDGIFTCPFCQ